MWGSGPGAGKGTWESPSFPQRVQGTVPVVEPSQASTVTQQGQKGTHKGDTRHKAENTPDPTAVGVWVEQMRRNRRSMSLFY